MYLIQKTKFTDQLHNYIFPA